MGNAANSTITYSPSGYNPTYAAWEIEASGNAVTATLTPAASHPLSNPVFILDNYTKGSLPVTISVNGSTASSGYYASVDTAGQRLWITVNDSSITSASPLNLVVSQSEAPAPGITSFPASAPANTSITITGANFKGTTPITYTVTAITFNGFSATTWTVNSATSLGVTVPIGATTGPIAVTTTGGGVATSATSFSPLYTLSVVAKPLSGDGTVTADAKLECHRNSPTDTNGAGQ